MMKKHPITIICKWMSEVKETILENQLYYFIIDTNNEKVMNFIQDNVSNEILDALDRPDIEKYVHSVLSSRYKQVTMSNSELSDIIAYPFIFHGKNEQNHFIYDWYFFWFNLTQQQYSHFQFEEIDDSI